VRVGNGGTSGGIGRGQLDIRQLFLGAEEGVGSTSVYEWARVGDAWKKVSSF
jgi:hypothetical protein